MLDQFKDSTGISGLDNILEGGLPSGHFYLLEGEPGTGKTTLAMQFVLAGIAAGESVLFVTLSETADELNLVAKSHGWSLEGVNKVELERDIARHEPDAQYTVFEATEVELSSTVGALFEAARRLKPKRIVIDSVSELRLLTRDSLRLRRELLGMKRFFSEVGATVIILDDRTSVTHEGMLRSIAHGVISLERLTTDYGSERRRLNVAKLRGARFREGYHDYRVNTGGLEVYPRLVAAEHRKVSMPGQLLSGVGNLDDLLGGGLDKGTSTIVMGPSGIGKSTIGMVYSVAAAEKNEKTLILLFDENMGTYLARDRGLQIGLAQHIENGTVELRQIDPTEVSPGELTQIIRDAVELEGFKHLIVDSINGVLQGMPGERSLLAQLHELLSYLNQSNITTLITLAQHGMMGAQMTSPAEVSYLADTVILLRFFEYRGEIKHAISVVKKRTGNHERTLRMLRIGKGGFEVGEPLSNFQGILTGVPTYVSEGEFANADRR